MVDVQLSQDAGRFFATVSRTSFAVGRATKFPEAQGNRRGDRRMWGGRRFRTGGGISAACRVCGADFLHPTVSVEGGL